MRDTKRTESARQLRILRAVGILIFLNSCSRGTAQGVTISQKTFYQVDGMNAAIRNSLLAFTGWDLVTCADACVRNARCVAFSLETDSSTTVCQLGSVNSTVLANPPGMSVTLYYTRSIPSGYTFATITDKVHYLKSLPGTMTYTTALAACKKDGADQLVQDDKGLAWHNFILQYGASNNAASGRFWIGGDDLDGNHIYNWNDGTLVSAAVQTLWGSGEPSFSWDGVIERCMAPDFGNLWNDEPCSLLYGVICEFRLP
ncbi:unnamed protein product [Darwinula stevensoni]|uniref:C-type lectin n=1 Tax=Darwinula stevensoni TaxID=69355 RepID=A0A7R9ABK0_9CRUS|nr:unnamed protein product [Darwinula stevensoni]CAG0899131.1 unnamed protein product [Darwinula stevensoni]